MDVELQLVDGFAVLERAELIVGEDGALPLPAEIAKGQRRLRVHRRDRMPTGSTRSSATSTGQHVRVMWPDELRDVFSLNVRFGPKAYGPGTSALDAIWDAVDGEFPGVGNAWCQQDRRPHRPRQAGPVPA